MYWDPWESDPHGDISFGIDLPGYYERNILVPFFRAALVDGVTPALPEAVVFDTGARDWRFFDHWPPRRTQEHSLYLLPQGRLALDEPPKVGSAADSFVSDPGHPVPYTEHISVRMVPQYMTEDQRFATKRSDVLVYQTEPLKADTTLAGPISAELFVSTTGTDADWIVKVIDVFPGDAKEPSPTLPPAPPPPSTMNPMRKLGGYQLLIRSEVIRGRSRNSYSAPEPFTPDAVTPVQLPLQDVLHTFKAGHRIMVQVQSTWFPLVDRNPQKYVPNIFLAEPGDFIKATHRVHHDPASASRLRIGVLVP
jgi:predicted acyl esterase